MTSITDATYSRSQRRSKPTAAVQRLARRLDVEPRTVYQLARRLDVSLYWLDLASRPDVVGGTPSSWDACIAAGIDPLTGEPLREAS